MKICGACLHDCDAHTNFNHSGMYMYCGNCNKLCHISEYNTKHKPSKISELPLTYTGINRSN